MNEQRRMAAQVDMTLAVGPCITRREALRRAGAGAALISVPGFLGACGGDDGNGSSGSTSSGPAKVPAAAGALTYIGYEGYDLVKPMQPWKKKNGVTVKSTYIGSQDDIIAKFRGGGGGGIDLVYCGTPTIQRYREAGKIVSDLDPQKLPNLKNLLPYFAAEKEGHWTSPDGTRQYIPQSFSTFGITYDSAVVKQAPTAIEDLTSPQFKGKLLMLDDPGINIQLACSILGLNAKELKESDLPQIEDFLGGLLAQTRSVSPSFGDIITKLVSGEGTVVFAGFPGLNLFAFGGGKKTIKTNVDTKERSLTFIDGLTVGVEADNADSAYAFLNEMLKPDINAQACGVTGAAPVVKGAQSRLDPATAALYDSTDIEARFEQAPLVEDLPLQSTEFVNVQQWAERWNELKSRTT